jgi:hypothetical protein
MSDDMVNICVLSFIVYEVLFLPNFYPIIVIPQVLEGITLASIGEVTIHRKRLIEPRPNIPYV